MTLLRYLPSTRACCWILAVTSAWCGVLAFHARVSPLAWQSVQIDAAKSREQRQLGHRFSNPLTNAEGSAIQILEDAVPLQSASREEVTTKGAGRFAATAKNLWISSTDGSDPRTNGRRYEVKFPFEVPTWLGWITAAAFMLAFIALLLQEETKEALRELRHRHDTGCVLLLLMIFLLALPKEAMPISQALTGGAMAVWSAAGMALAFRQRSGGSTLERRWPILTGWLKYYGQRQPNAKILGVFRICFGLLTALIAIRDIESFDFLFHRIEHQVLRGLLYGFVLLWAVIGVVMAAGIGGRWLRGANLVIGILLLRNSLTFGIFESTYLFTSWLAFLAPCDRRFSIVAKYGRSRGGGWMDSMLPVHLVGIHVGLVLFCVGVDKAVCPLWLHGVGFYSFVCLPWALPPHWHFLAEHHWLMFLGNWGGLAIELAFLPLWLWSKTRFLAVAGGLALLLSLLWPFNIFLIAPVGVCMMLGLSSILWPEDAQPATRQTDASYMVWAAVPIFSVIFLLTELGRNVFAPLERLGMAELPQFNHPRDLEVQTPPRAETCTEEMWNDLNFRDLRKPWDAVTLWGLGIKRYSLFSKHHTLGMYGYRVVVTMEDGSQVEPWPCFTPSKERGEAQDQWCELNLVLGMAYAIGDLARLLSYGRDDPETRAAVERFWMIPVMDYSQMHLTPAQKQQAKFVSLLVAPFECSTTFKGQLPQRNDDWAEFFVLDLAESAYHYKDMPVRHEVQGRDSRLPDYLPYVNERWFAPTAKANGH